MQEDTLQELQQKAVEAALKSGNIDDFEKAANITKQVVDINKEIAARTTEPKLLRFEELKTWASLIVPFLSIATLAVTIYIQSVQLTATREANEDTQWRETVKNVLTQLSKPTKVAPDPALAMALLEPYTSNSRFGKDATRISVELLSRVPSTDRFRDYFLSHHLGEGWADIDFLTNLNRGLYSNLTELDTRSGQPGASELIQAARDATIDDIRFITERMCALYKAAPTARRLADFRDVLLMDGDLSHVDLGGADLRGAKLQNINLTDTTLAGDIKFSEDPYFVDSHWWDAREISKPLLKVLLDTKYPYYDNEGFPYKVPPPDKDQYVKRVQQLCQKVGMVCKSEELKYGSPPVPQKTDQPQT